MTTIETKTAFAAQVPDQSFADLLRTLHEPIAVNLIKSREGWTDFSGHKQMVDYVEWHTVADILDRQAPTWQHTIRQITQMRETVIVIAALTIEGVTREGIGTGPANTETGIKKAEHDALKRAAIKFGIARELYQHDRAHGGQQPQQAQPMPTHPVAQSTSDLATPKQLGLISRLCRELELDAEQELQETLKLDCTLAELSRRAASGFIDHLQALRRP